MSTPSLESIGGLGSGWSPNNATNILPAKVHAAMNVRFVELYPMSVQPEPEQGNGADPQCADVDFESR